MMVPFASLMKLKIDEKHAKKHSPSCPIKKLAFYEVTDILEFLFTAGQGLWDSRHMQSVKAKEEERDINTKKSSYVISK